MSLKNVSFNLDTIPEKRQTTAKQWGQWGRGRGRNKRGIGEAPYAFQKESEDLHSFQFKSLLFNMVDS